MLLRFNKVEESYNEKTKRVSLRMVTFERLVLGEFYPCFKLLGLTSVEKSAFGNDYLRFSVKMQEALNGAIAI